MPLAWAASRRVLLRRPAAQQQHDHHGDGLLLHGWPTESGPTVGTLVIGRDGRSVARSRPEGRRGAYGPVMCARFGCVPKRRRDEMGSMTAGGDGTDVQTPGTKAACLENRNDLGPSRQRR